MDVGHYEFALALVLEHYGIRIEAEGEHPALMDECQRKVTAITITTAANTGYLAKLETFDEVIDLTVFDN